jgi:hypothetical protein
LGRLQLVQSEASLKRISSINLEKSGMFPKKELEHKGVFRAAERENGVANSPRDPTLMI